MNTGLFYFPKGFANAIEYNIGAWLYIPNAIACFFHFGQVEGGCIGIHQNADAVGKCVSFSDGGGTETVKVALACRAKFQQRGDAMFVLTFTPEIGDIVIVVIVDDLVGKITDDCDKFLLFCFFDSVFHMVSSWVGL